MEQRVGTYTTLTDYKEGYTREAVCIINVFYFGFLSLFILKPISGCFLKERAKRVLSVN